MWWLGRQALKFPKYVARAIIFMEITPIPPLEMGREVCWRTKRTFKIPKNLTFQICKWESKQRKLVGAKIPKLGGKNEKKNAYGQNNK
jgi:hypothetical protein